MGASKTPEAPRLRAIREAWLRPVIEQLEADPDISAVGFVGSLGRGDADDWSDVDLVIVVPDDQERLLPSPPTTTIRGSVFTEVISTISTSCSRARNGWGRAFCQPPPG